MALKTNCPPAPPKPMLYSNLMKPVLETAMPEVAKLSIKHEAIMAYMIANPTAQLGEVAAEFQVTQPWLSCIIHSHAFKTKLREMQDMMFGNLGASITEKLEAIAHTALDNLAQHVSASNAGPAMSMEVATLALDRLGYSAKAAAQPAQPGVQMNFFQLSRDDLAQARGVLLEAQPEPQQGELLEQNSPGAISGELLAQPAPVSSQE